jgi:hypothetical protein
MLDAISLKIQTKELITFSNDWSRLWFLIRIFKIIIGKVRGKVLPKLTKINPIDLFVI